MTTLETLPPGWDEIPGARGCTPKACAFRDHMAGKIGTYVSFFAEGIADSSQSDMEYYSKFLEWHENLLPELHLVSDHDEVAASL